MTKILELDYKETDTHIEFFIVFEVDKESEYISCFNGLHHLEQEDNIYSYKTFAENCNTVKGVLLDLEELNNNVKPNSIFLIETRLLRLIETIILFWH